MKKYLLTGLLVWAPIAVTIWLITLVFGSINSLFRNLLIWINQIFGVQVSPILLKISSIPGVGILTLMLIIGITGLFAANIVGKWWLDIWYKFIKRIPIIKSIYFMTKQIFDALLSDNGKSFKEAVLIEYPRKDIWTIAFITGISSHIINPNSAENDYISVFIPTTPNPTSGFLLLIKKSTVKPLDITVDQALKYIVSMGVLNINIDNTEELNKGKLWKN